MTRSTCFCPTTLYNSLARLHRKGIFLFLVGGLRVISYVAAFLLSLLACLANVFTNTKSRFKDKRRPWVNCRVWLFRCFHKFFSLGLLHSIVCLCFTVLGKRDKISLRVGGETAKEDDSPGISQFIASCRRMHWALQILLRREKEIVVATVDSFCGMICHRWIADDEWPGMVDEHTIGFASGNIRISALMIQRPIFYYFWVPCRCWKWPLAPRTIHASVLRLHQGAE